MKEILSSFLNNHGGLFMPYQGVSPEMPGTYQYRPISFLPAITVRVIKESIQREQTLCMRVAGLTLRMSSFSGFGVWYGPLL